MAGYVATAPFFEQLYRRSNVCNGCIRFTAHSVLKCRREPVICDDAQPMRLPYIARVMRLL